MAAEHDAVMIYDVQVDVHSHMNRLTPVPGFVVFFHVDRQSRAGAVSHAMAVMRGLERKYVSYVAVQDCPGEGSACWHAHAAKNGASR